ncbi:putative microfibril-associated glycoprotein 4-like [Apostichopus japonicus]|uniref:Putative microfibril-associated glycoprotein 4-like n=1 Tax=Stichopus japonicus TaxID=307972 RepID=A0A2G8LMG9_STIJA|nr:putative microfibril-associated glycoprotein 4-like [Apostichopus japonicus]
MDCYDLYVDGIGNDGVYTIYPDGWMNGIQAYCEMTSNGGGWTFLQRRSSASVDVYRTWDEYKNGFEHPSRDHWLGYNAMHYSNSQQFSTHDRDNDDWSSYDCAEGHRGAWWFRGNHHCQRDNSTDYCMSNCRYCNMFRDGNDDCVLCADAHLNGVYGEYNENAQGKNIFWGGIKKGCSLQYTEMKIRPV